MSTTGDIEKTNYATDNKALSDPESPQNHSRDGEAAVGVVEDFGEKGELKQGLHQRHIQMIALAGAIGTGLFLGSGGAIEKGGPLGALLGYFFVGVLVVGVVFSIAELRYVLLELQSETDVSAKCQYNTNSACLTLFLFPAVHWSHCLAPSSVTPNTLSIPPSRLHKAGTRFTTTSSRCPPN